MKYYIFFGFDRSLFLSPKMITPAVPEGNPPAAGQWLRNAKKPP
jgi:hypothetical protein